MAVLGIRPDTLLDVGAGAAYIEVARAEALRRGHGPRVEFRHGDFLALAPELSFPHDRWYMRVHTWWQNRRRRRAGNRFRTFIHPVAQIHSVLQEAGLEVRISRRTLGWEVLVCTWPTASDERLP